MIRKYLQALRVQYIIGPAVPQKGGAGTVQGEHVDGPGIIAEHQGRNSEGPAGDHVIVLLCQGCAVRPDHGHHGIGAAFLDIGAPLGDVGAADHPHQGDGVVPNGLGLIEDHGGFALEGLRQHWIVQFLRNLGGGQPQHGGGHSHGQEDHGRRSQQGNFFRAIHGHLVLLLFRCVPHGCQLLKSPLLEVRGEVHGVKCGAVVLAIHSTSSFKSWRSRSRPRESRVPTVGRGICSSLEISLME